MTTDAQRGHFERSVTVTEKDREVAEQVWDHIGDGASWFEGEGVIAAAIATARVEGYEQGRTEMAVELGRAGVGVPIGPPERPFTAPRPENYRPYA